MVTGWNIPPRKRRREVPYGVPDDHERAERIRQYMQRREGEAEPMKFSSDLVPDPRQAIPE